MRFTFILIDASMVSHHVCDVFLYKNEHWFCAEYGSNSCRSEDTILDYTPCYNKTKYKYTVVVYIFTLRMS
jgi:hypothetical protein